MSSPARRATFPGTLLPAGNPRITWIVSSTVVTADEAGQSPAPGVAA